MKRSAPNRPRNGADTRVNGRARLNGRSRDTHDAHEAGAATLAERKAPWLDYIAGRGLKVSKAREQIVDVFLGLQNHVDLAEILARVRERHPNTSPATVYRTVKLLEDAGIAQSRHFGDRQTLYELAAGRAHHDHLICERCGEITEFADEDIERLQEDVARDHGFTLHKHRHELFGLCAECRAGDTGKE
jgi:Fur family ferric uptake transcriptional regulator